MGNGSLEGRNENNGCLRQLLVNPCRTPVQPKSEKQVFMDEN
jgi:hypothetical protein